MLTLPNSSASLTLAFTCGGDNVAFWGPLAWTMIFGLVMATFLTLLVVPTMYILGYKTRAWFRRKLGNGKTSAA
jgi:multidrug efflux pump